MRMLAVVLAITAVLLEGSRGEEEEGVRDVFAPLLKERLAASAHVEASGGRVTSLPGWEGELPSRQFSGYLQGGEATCGNFLFYWLAEAQTREGEDAASKPLVLFLNGGPGSSSLLFWLFEGGPFRVSPDAATLEAAPGSWASHVNLLVIDQPANVGFSFSERPECAPTNYNASSAQLASALASFFRLYPQFDRVYLAGESYAGTWLPLLATELLERQPSVTLAGLLVGDGWVAPQIQQGSYADFAYNHGLISPSQRTQVDTLFAKCRAAFALNRSTSNAVCEDVEGFIAEVSGVNVYDVRREGSYNFSNIVDYLGREDVRAALHVDARAPVWSPSSEKVGNVFAAGEQDDVSGLYAELFEKLPVLLYYGEYDMDCNFAGADEWLRTVEWSGAQQFNSLGRTPWVVNGTVLGFQRSFKNLIQVVLRDCGHLVPHDAPQAALTMLKSFVK